MPGPDGDAELQDAARRRQEPVVRILGVDAALDRVPVRRQQARRIEIEPLAARDPDLPAHQIDAGHHLGDRMLDLEPRVHLEEVEARRPRRAGTRSCRRWCSRPTARRRRPRCVIAARSGGRDGQRRRLLDHLLMAPLDRALAFDERQHRAVVVGEQLHLDVARPRQPAFEVHRRVAERRAGLGPRGADRGRQVRRGRSRSACPCRRRRRPP